MFYRRSVFVLQTNYWSLFYRQAACMFLNLDTNCLSILAHCIYIIHLTPLMDFSVSDYKNYVCYITLLTETFIFSAIDFCYRNIFQTLTSHRHRSKSKFKENTQGLYDFLNLKDGETLKDE